jgi:hypothetical protein
MNISFALLFPEKSETSNPIFLNTKYDRYCSTKTIRTLTEHLASVKYVFFTCTYLPSVMTTNHLRPRSHPTLLKEQPVFGTFTRKRLKNIYLKKHLDV